MLATTILTLQFMISAKAGLVNYIDGQANVRLHQQVPPGVPIQTGSGSHAEILLNPGSFLRLDENTTVVFDAVELTNIAVRVVAGTVVIESAEVDKQAPIRVTSGNLRSLIVAQGVYRFSGDTAYVMDGKLRPADSSLTVKKGQEITAVGDHYEKNALTLSTDSAALDSWSRQRSSELAAANAMAYREQSSGSVYSSSGSVYSSSGSVYSYGGFYPTLSLLSNSAA